MYYTPGGNRRPLLKIRPQWSGLLNKRLFRLFLQLFPIAGRLVLAGFENTCTFSLQRETGWCSQPAYTYTYMQFCT